MSAVEPSPLDIQALYSDHHSWLRGWLYNKLGCGQGAADLVQDTFVRILQRQAKTSEPLDVKEPRAYLTTVAGRLVYDLFRRQSLERAYLQALAVLPAPETPSEEQQYLIRKALWRLDAMLDRLKPAVRQAFLLSQLQGLSYAKIGEQLSLSERTVKRYMAIAFEECILLMDESSQ